jgi:WD40 repeat protein
LGEVVKVWDFENRDLLESMFDMVSVAWMVTFSPDERTIISSAADETIRVWGIPPQ